VHRVIGKPLPRLVAMGKVDGPGCGHAAWGIRLVHDKPLHLESKGQRGHTWEGVGEAPDPSSNDVVFLYVIR
jgi:hypothetical protein